MTGRRSAAGGVVWRRRPFRLGASDAAPRPATVAEGDDVEVALVHRPRYDDWSLPKGKLNPAENVLVGAVREVYEETGLVVSPQVRLPGTRYPTARAGEQKVVDYWSMGLRRDDGHPGDDEVDEVRWVPPRQAERLLSYPGDRRVVAAFTELPPVTSVVVVVRHARAGSRGDWDGPDADRPLDALGEAQVAALTPVLRLFAPDRLVSAPPLRCRATIAPLAADGLALRVEPVLGEEDRAEPDVVAAWLRHAATTSTSTVVCSQGKVIPPALEALAACSPRLHRGAARPDGAASYQTGKGGGWVLAFSGSDLIAADPLPVASTD